MFVKLSMDCKIKVEKTLQMVVQLPLDWKIKVEDPKVKNPKVENPKVENPKVDNPKVKNTSGPSIFPSGINCCSLRIHAEYWLLLT